MKESISMKIKWILDKYNKGEDSPYERVIFLKNVALNEGIAVLANLLVNKGTPTHYGEANAYLGVGNSNVATSATQTGLQGTNFYAPMESGFPTISDQTIKWRAIFGADDANFDWQEFTLANGNSNAADNFNRQINNQGTKAQGQTWTLELNITFS